MRYILFFFILTAANLMQAQPQKSTLSQSGSSTSANAVTHVTLIPKVVSEWPRFYCGPEDKARVRQQIEAAQATVKVNGALIAWAYDNKETWSQCTSDFWGSIHKQYDGKEFVSGRRLGEQLQSFNIIMALGMTSPADYQWMEKKVATYINRQVVRYPKTLSRKGGMGNGDIEQYYPMLQAAILFPRNPDAQRWLDCSVDWISQCVQGCWIDGVGLESDRYYGTVLSELSDSLPMIEHCTGINLYRSPALRAGLEWWIRYISPPVIPHSFPYTLPPWGDADIGADFGNHLPYVKAYGTFDPDFSRRLAGWWRKSGGKVPDGWMNPLIEPQIVDLSLPGNPDHPSAPVTSTYSPTFGQMTMRSESGDANELFLTMKCGKGPNGHCHGDQGSIELYAFGRMLLTESYCGPYNFGMDWARASRAHNTVVYDNNSTDGTVSGQFQAYGASTVADYCTVSWKGSGTARHVVMVKPDYVVIWDQAAAGSFSDYWMHSNASKLDWQPHKVGVVTKPGDVTVDVHFLLPTYPLPAPVGKGEPQTGNEITTHWMASRFPEPNSAGPYTREGLGLQAWGLPPNPPPDDPKSRYIKYFSVRSATAGGHFLTVLHPRKAGVTPELKPELISASSTSVVLKVSFGGRVDTIKIDNNGATIVKGGQPPVQFARTYPWSGVSGPARFILCQDNAVETLTKPLTITGAVELIIGKLVLGANNVLPSSAPLIVRPCGQLELGGHSITVDKLIVDCGTITGPGTITCNAVDWYGGVVSPETKIICTGNFRKFAGSIQSLPGNITCASGMTLVGDDKK